MYICNKNTQRRKKVKDKSISTNDNVKENSSLVWWSYKVRPSSLVHNTALYSDFPIFYNTHITKSHHGSCKFSEEQVLVSGEWFYYPFSPVITIQPLVGGKYAFSCKNSLIIVIIESGCRGVQKLAGIPILIRFGAFLLQTLCKFNVHAGIGVVCGAEITKPGFKRRAMGKSQRVSSRKSNQISNS